jgi:phage regulator Rha-like protein
MSSREIAELTGKRHDNVMADIRTMLVEIQSPEILGDYKDSRGRTQPCILLNKDESMCLVAGYNANLRMAIIKRWQDLERNIIKPALPSVKELALMVIAAEEEKEKALLLVEEKSQHIEGLESLFHSGGTITQFAKQLNGVNCNKINLWLYDNTKWLYDDNKGKLDKHGNEKPYYWRASTYARDKYITERPLKLAIQGKESLTKYEVNLLANGKRWIFKKYITGQLSSCMKSTWDGKYTQEKDLHQPEANIEWLENTTL